MSRIRGLFPLFLATGFGVANGLAAFGPAFKEQELEKEAAARELADLAQQESNVQVNALRDAEAEASSVRATTDAVAPQKSQWSLWNIWARESSKTAPEVSMSQQSQAKAIDNNNSGERS